jgi:hypothetical protein
MTVTLETWDGWGMPPSEHKVFEENMKVQEARRKKFEETADTWQITYKHVQGKTNISEIIKADSYKDAYSKAIQHFGTIKDQMNEFIHVKPVLSCFEETLKL